MSPKLLILAFFIILLPAEMIAQDLGLSGTSQFRRQLDSFFWSYTAGFDQETDSFSISVANIFNSRFYLLDGNPQNIQDENVARLAGSFALTDKTGLLLESRSVRFTNTNLKQDWAIMGVQYGMDDLFSVAGLAGFMQDERSAIRDNGLLLGFRGSTAPYDFGDFTLQTDLHADYGDISPRTFQNWRMNTYSVVDVENFRMEADLNLARNIRDSYQASSFFNRDQTDFIESVRNDTTGIAATAFFPIMDQIQARVDISALNNVRTVSNRQLAEDLEDELFDTRITRQQLDVRFEADYRPGRAQLRGGFAWSTGTREARLLNADQLSSDTERRRTDILVNSNFEQQRFELFTNNFLPIGESNTTQISGRVSIFNYDTPAVNRDDRDELFYQLIIGNRHIFSDNFRAGITLSGEATHTVYLFSERSIENNWRRSIRLRPELQWDPAPWLRTRYQFLVRANYTVDDFELEGRPRNDQASREYQMRIEAEANIAPEWWVDVSGSRSELRIGRLLWDSFREIPTDTLITYDSRMMLTHRSGQLLTSVGVRYFIKLDYLPRATVSAADTDAEGNPITRTRTAPGRQVTRQWGPMVEMSLPLYARNELIVNGWYQMQSIRQRLYTEYPEEFRDIFLRAEGQARRNNYPNIEIIARFRF